VKPTRPVSATPSKRVGSGRVLTF